MKFSIVLPANQPTTTIKELLEIQWLVPRKVRHFLRIRKAIEVNQQPVHFQQIVQAGDCITLAIEDSDYSFQPVAYGNPQFVQPLFEDEHLLIVDKPAGMKTHPNQPQEKDTLLNHAVAYLQSSGQRPYVVHRLDKETSGAILFAKNPFVLPILSRLLEEKKIYRRYQAIVHGKLLHDRTINKKIGRDRHDRRKRIVDERRGQTAITHVTVDTVLPTCTRLYCVLDTGRTHQIRVHLASLHHPIIGDPLYQSKKAPRLMLHAQELHLVHPFSQQTIAVHTRTRLW